MGTAGLIDIKRRVKSVENTRKITRAMGLVATSKLKKARRELLIDEENLELNKEIFTKVISLIDEDYESAYFGDKISSDTKLYIVVTSDTGLCGGFNGNVANYIKNNLAEDKENVKMIVLGAKGTSYMKKLGFTNMLELVELSDLPTIKEVRSVYQRAKYLFLKGDVSEVNIVYTEYISPMKQEVTTERLLPLERIYGEAKDIVIEPNIKYVLDVSIERYLRSKLRRDLLHSKVSEQSARRDAMDSATRNANELLKTLNLRYNRLRQSMITQEISEIVGGAEAQK